MPDAPTPKPAGLSSVLTPTEKWLFSGIATVLTGLIGWLFLADIGHGGAIKDVETDMATQIGELRDENRDDTLEAIINELRHDISALTAQVQNMNSSLVDVRIALASKADAYTSRGEAVPESIREELNRVDAELIEQGIALPAITPVE